MKILITGVYGFVGRNFYVNFKKKYKIIGIGSRKKNKDLKETKNLINKKITFKNLINLKFKPDLILHCAGSGSVMNSFKNKKNDYIKNVKTTEELLKFIQNLEKKPKLIFFSSAAVYGNSCNKYKKKINPISPYGKNKIICEKIIKLFSKKFKLQFNILRFYSIYGDGLKKQLIWDACKKIKLNKNVFFGTGEEIRSWIHIKDVVSFVDFLIKKNLYNNILDVSGHETLKNKMLLQKLYLLNNLKIKPKFNNTKKKGDPLYQIYDGSKIKKLGWSPKIRLHIGLRKYLLWFKKFQIK